MTRCDWDEGKRVWRVTLAAEEWDDEGGETGWEGEKGWDGARREILRKEGLLSGADGQANAVQAGPARQWVEEADFVISGIGALKWVSMLRAGCGRSLGGADDPVLANGGGRPISPGSSPLTPP